VEEPVDVGSDGEHFGYSFDPARADLSDSEIAGIMGTTSFDAGQPGCIGESTAGKDEAGTDAV